MFKVSMTRLLTTIFVFAWIGLDQSMASKIILQGSGSRQVSFDSDEFKFLMEFKNFNSYNFYGVCREFTLTVGSCELKFQTKICQGQNYDLLIDQDFKGYKKRILFGVVSKSSIVINGFTSNPKTFECKLHFDDQLAPRKFAVKISLLGDVTPDLVMESNDNFYFPTKTTSTVLTQAPTTQTETTQKPTIQAPTTSSSMTHSTKTTHKDEAKKEKKLLSNVEIAIIVFVSVFALLSILFSVGCFMFRRRRPKKPVTASTTTGITGTTTIENTRDGKDANKLSLIQQGKILHRFISLMRLKRAVEHLFADAIDEDTIFKQLHVEPRFASATQADVKSFYEHLEEKNELKTWYQQQELLMTQTETEHTQLKLKLDELKRIQKLCQNAENFLFYDAKSDENVDIWQMWNGRFSLDTKNGKADEETHKITSLDLLQRQLGTYDIQKKNNHCCVYTLTYPFLLFVDGIPSNGRVYVRLVRFNPENDSMQVVQMLSCKRHCYALVDSCDFSKFILMYENKQIQICKLINGQIRKIKLFNKDRNAFKLCSGYFKDHFYDLRIVFDEYPKNDKVQVLIWDLINDTAMGIKLNPLRNDIIFTRRQEGNLNVFEFALGKLFASVKFTLTDDYGVVYADLKTKNWTLINFATYSPIEFISFVGNQNLMICAKKDDKQQIYKFPLRKPDFLRNMIWIKLVNLFKQAKVDEPYAEAREDLGLNFPI